MTYKYEETVVNINSMVNNYIGYILPDGSLYRCKNHNVSNVYTVLKMYLSILKTNYKDKDEILSSPVSDKLLLLVIKFLKNASYDKIVALSNFIETSSIGFSDLTVELFGCHLIARRAKTIVTCEVDHSCFFNYLLHDFRIDNVDKIIYDEEKKEYVYYHDIHDNRHVYEEISEIKEEVKENEIELFYKVK